MKDVYTELRSSVNTILVKPVFVVVVAGEGLQHRLFMYKEFRQMLVIQAHLRPRSTGARKLNFAGFLNPMSQIFDNNKKKSTRTTVKELTNKIRKKH